MLKSCWDCIAGSLANSNQVQNEEAYGIHLNGDAQRAPPWPSPQNNDTMFLLPRALKSGDKIHISGRITTSDRNSLTVSLVTDAGGMPDYQNDPCQIDVRFRENEVLLKSITNGMPASPEDYHGESASSQFGGLTFDFQFTMSYEDGPVIETYIGPSFLGTIPLNDPYDVQRIRFLTVQGDDHKVDKLDFEFA